MNPKYVIRERKTTPFGPFYVEEATIQIIDSSGKRTEEKRINFERGDSVAVLVCDVERDEIVLARQFRYSALANRSEAGDGWLLEIPAGVVGNNEDADTTARREVEEEIGLSVKDLEHVATFFASPGGTSERIYLFYAEAGKSIGSGGGLTAEGECIKIERIPVTTFIEMVLSNRIRDAKTIIAGYWLQKHLQRNSHAE